MQAPPPKYLTPEELRKPLPTKKEDVMAALEESPFGALICTDKDAMDRQKGILVDVLRQLTMNLLRGLTISHISLPVKIFEPRSTIQRLVDLFSHAPTYLSKAAEISDPLERMNLVITFSIGSMYLLTSQLKPFNPILGETLQAELPDGTEIFCEHTSHHPPISNFLMHPKDKSYEFWGYYEFTGSMAANSLRACQKGPNNIRFADGHHIRFSLPDYKLGGTIKGDRTIEPVGSMVFEDLTYNNKAVIIFSTYKKEGWWHVVESGRKDEFFGKVYKAEPINVRISNKHFYSKHSKEIKDLSELKDVVEELYPISGSWLRSLKINEQTYWDIEESKPQRQIPVIDGVLPSDWRFREDLLWLKYNNMRIAHNWKVRLEEQQRHDRRLRQAKEQERIRGTA